MKKMEPAGGDPAGDDKMHGKAAEAVIIFRPGNW